jgi:hypothetical protein
MVESTASRLGAKALRFRVARVVSPTSISHTAGEARRSAVTMPACVTTHAPPLTRSSP